MEIVSGDEVDNRSRYLTSQNGLRSAGLINSKDSKRAPLIWIDGIITMDDAENMLPFQRANKIPCMDFLCYKSTLFCEVNQQRKRFPNIFDFYPFSYLLPNDFPEFQKRHQLICSRTSQSPTWVVKPKNGCCGRGIKLIRSTHEAEEITDNSVAQLYIDPYLLDGYKFDFRLFILITSLEPLGLFIYKEGIARFCTERYQAPSKSNKNNQFTHLTNTSINKCSTKNPLEFTKKASDVFKRFGANQKSIWEKIRRAIALFIASMHPSMVACLPKKENVRAYSKLESRKDLPTSKKSRRFTSPDRTRTNNANVQPPVLNQPSSTDSEPKKVVEFITQENMEQNQQNIDQSFEQEKQQVKDENNEAGHVSVYDLKLPETKKYFHILGIDIILDSRLNPQILELNDRPSLMVTVPFEEELKTNMIRECFYHITHDGETSGETEKSQWEQILPAKPGSELDNQVRQLCAQKSDLKYTGRPPDKGPATNRIVQSGINQQQHLECRSRFEEVSQNLKAPRFNHFLH